MCQNKFHGQPIIQGFEKSCNQIQVDREQIKTEGRLYKYTDYAGLESILKTQKLRYTDYRYFNDPTEISFGIALIKEAIYKSKIPDVNKNLIMGTLTKIFDNFDDNYHLYVSCFSTSIEKLSLWRYYAHGGTGYAISFNKEFFKIAKPRSTGVGQPIICQAIYGIEKAQQIISQFIHSYINYLNISKDMMNRLNVTDEIRLQFIKFITDLDSRLAANLISFLPGFKDKSFEDEDEVRIFFIEGEGIYNPKTNKLFYFEDSKREFIPMINNSYPFVNLLTGNKPILKPEEFLKTDISEIWIGPCCEFVEAKAAISNLLKQQGYNCSKIEIKKAKLPYQHM